ncbi:GDP-fructose:GMP antiporter, putative [Plasmodium ovale curtisi]|uniref:GDP-fructose:GMP antiporter, putative n=1 Tax=Plasmodium ovale curtisi TaxID=864141 RepID=A0A1A8VK57_PLAOA|nr:GDP-fructose:GMP antiporter, putative [Plasmodium ovale curtisi]SBS81539.1 GDP-fructose:GMP antiporter, putative [Plasmodium ovale curtisi]
MPGGKGKQCRDRVYDGMAEIRHNGKVQNPCIPINNNVPGVINNHLAKIQSGNDMKKEEDFSLWEGIKNLWLLIITFNFTLIFGNLCLKHTNLSFYQLARSMTLPFNFLFSYFFFKQIRFNFLMTSSCILVSIGFFVFSLDAMHTNRESILYGTTVSVVQAIHLNILKQKLTICKNKMTMLRYNLTYSSIILFFYLLVTRDIFTICNLNQRASLSLALSCKFHMREKIAKLQKSESVKSEKMKWKGKRDVTRNPRGVGRGNIPHLIHFRNVLILSGSRYKAVWKDRQGKSGKDKARQSGRSAE